MPTPIRMKDKKMNRIHLGASGAMEISVVQASSDAASKASTAQPTNPLTQQESRGLNSGPEAAMGSEPGTGSTLQGPELLPTSAGPMESPSEDITAATEGPGEAEDAPVTESAPLPPALGETAPAPQLSLAPAKDPNAQKETTQMLNTTPPSEGAVTQLPTATTAPNMGAGKVVGETKTK